MRTRLETVLVWAGGDFSAMLFSTACACVFFVRPVFSISASVTIGEREQNAHYAQLMYRAARNRRKTRRVPGQKRSRWRSSAESAIVQIIPVLFLLPPPLLLPMPFDEQHTPVSPLPRT